MSSIEPIESTQAQKAQEAPAAHVHGFQKNLTGWALVSMISIMASQWTNSENRVTASAELSTAYNKLVKGLSDQKEQRTEFYMSQIVAEEKKMTPSDKDAFSQQQAEVQVLNQEMTNSKTFYGASISTEQAVSTRATNDFSNDMSNLTSIFDAMKTVSSKTTSLLTTLLNVVGKGRI